MREMIAMPNKVIIEYIPAGETERESGLLVAGPKYQGIPDRGKVISVGAGVEDVEVGMNVLFNVHSPVGFKFEGKSYIPVDSKDLMGILK